MKQKKTVTDAFRAANRGNSRSDVAGDPSGRFLFVPKTTREGA
jgi:hypothetical protein